MINYRHYKSTDFATDPLFREWVLNRDSAAKSFWNEWLVENPGMVYEIDNARALLLALEEKELTADDGEIKARVEETIRLIRETKNETELISFAPRWYHHFMRIAATAVLVLGLGWLATRYFRQDDTARIETSAFYPAEAGIAQFNDSPNPISIVLDDSSVVVLKPGSELHYPKTFEAAKREVHLKGEAFFQITRNPNRPFLVMTDELITEVLGTSFTVKSFEKDRNASVSVKTGRVSVYTKAEGQLARKADSKEIVGVILKPNQEVVYDKEVSRLVKVIVPSPQPIAVVPSTALVFDESPVKNVFRLLEKEYGIEIIANEETLSACLLTANLSGLSLYDQLDMICKIIHARYEIIDAQIVIHSKGCS